MLPISMTPWFTNWAKAVETTPRTEAISEVSREVISPVRLFSKK